MSTQVFVFGNNIDTDITASLTASATSITIASATGIPSIPSGQYLPLTIIHPATAGIFEVVWVSAASGTTLTALRGQEGSTAHTWNTGDSIYSDVTKQVLTNFNNVIQTGAYSYSATDTGTTNAYVIALNPAITSYTDGMVVSFKPANSNTGASTLNAGGGAKTIQMANNALQGGEIVANATIELQYSATNSVWQIIGGAGSTQTGLSTASTQAPQTAQVQKNSFNYSGTDTGTANAYVIALTPTITVYTDGMIVSLTPTNSNTGASTLNAGGGVEPILLAGAALAGGEIVANKPLVLQWSGAQTSWIIVGGSNVSGGAGRFTTCNASGNDALLYTNSSNQLFSATTTVTITGWTLVYDRLGTNFNASTGVFTAPSTGYYLVGFTVNIAGTSIGQNVALQVQVDVNGSYVAGTNYNVPATGAYNKIISGTYVVAVTAGQTIQLQFDNGAASNQNLAPTGTFTSISIARIP